MEHLGVTARRVVASAATGNCPLRPQTCTLGQARVGSSGVGGRLAHDRRGRDLRALGLGDELSWFISAS